MESIDVNGFRVLSSEAESVRRLFAAYPDIASNFRPQNIFLKRAYVNLLLAVIRTLSETPLQISEDDLTDASAGIISLKGVGFKLDWLEKKLEKVKENKEKIVTAEIRKHEIDEKLKELETLKDKLEEEKTSISLSIFNLKRDAMNCSIM